MEILDSRLGAPILIFIGSITGRREFGVASSLKNADGQRRVQEDKNQKKDMRSSLTDDGLAFDISGRTLQLVFFFTKVKLLQCIFRKSTGAVHLN